MGKPDAKVYDYLLSMHVGVAHGRIDSINRIRIKDKAVFGGRADRRTNICIDMPDLYGGDDKEGGPQGVIEFYPGDPEQFVSPELAARFGREPENCPGFRKLAHLFFRGRGAQAGFKWTTNNYYLPSFDVSLTDIPRALDVAAETDLAEIWPMGCVESEDPEEDEQETILNFEGGGKHDFGGPASEPQVIYPPWSSATLYSGRHYREMRIANPDEDDEGFCDATAGEDGYAQFLYPDGNTGDESWPTYSDVDSGRVTGTSESIVESIEHGGLAAGKNLHRIHVWTQIAFYAEELFGVLSVPTKVSIGWVEGHVLATSVTGQSWRAIQPHPNMPEITFEFADVTWVNDWRAFVAVTADGVLARSPNGEAWSETTIPEDDWSAITHAKSLGVTIAVSRDGDQRVLRNDLSADWTLHNAPGDHEWSAVIWAEELSLFVAVSEDGRVMTSPTGAAWTLRTSPAASWKSVCWSPDLNLLVAVGFHETGSCVMTSPNGTTWTARTTPVIADWQAVEWNPVAGVFVAAGFPSEEDAPAEALLSDDGIFWEPLPPISAEGVTDIVWNGASGRMVAAGPTGMFSSSNGRAWSRSSQGEPVPGRKLAVSSDMKTGILGRQLRGGSNRESGYDVVRSAIGVQAPPGARYMRVWNHDIRTFPIFSSRDFVESWYGLVWSKYSDVDQFSGIADDSLGDLPNANPAHIIYELMTDPEWGKGESPDLIDIPSHVAAAETLRNESFGLSFSWLKSSDIESQIQDVIDHIKAVYYQDPATAKWTIKLLRADYDPNTLKTINPDNAVIENSLRRSWAELANEIVVTYTDPDTEEEASVTSHNIATYVTEGGYVSEGRNYHAIRDVCLAQRVANRDIVEAAYPLWSGTAHLLRDEWDIRPGAVYRLDWPEDEIEGMIVRVLNVDYGKPGSRTIKATLTEDIFGVVGLDTTEVQPPLWRDPNDSAPSNLTAVTAMTPPLPEILRAGVSAEEVEDYSPGSLAMFMGAHDSAHVLDVSVFYDRRQHSIGTVPPLWDQVTKMPPTRTMVIPEDWPAEAFTVASREFINALGGGTLIPGSRLVLTRPTTPAIAFSNVPDLTSEIVQLWNFHRETQLWDVARGAYDTVPRAWPAGTRVWVLPGREAVDPNPHAVDVPLQREEYRLVPRMNRGMANVGYAPDTYFYPMNRESRPFRPANCQIDDNGFDPAIYDSEPFPSEVTATWRIRNRWAEDREFVPGWLDESFAPEEGQTVTLRITANPKLTEPFSPGEILAEYTGLSGESFNIPVSAFGAMQEGWVHFLAERDGFESLQFASRYVYVGAVGWNNTWSGKFGL